MPSQNQLKTYAPDAYYHIYNRGVGKMPIFHNKQDYNTFLYYLRIIFTPVDLLLEEFQQLKQSKSRNVSLSKLKSLQNAILQGAKLKICENVKLLSFCLMPNHFHLVVYQKVADGIQNLMRRLGSAYSGYYRRMHDWVGPVVQGRYHASLLHYDPKLQTLAACRYGERNSQEILNSRNVSWKMTSYPYSSLRFYVMQDKGERSPVWLDTQLVTTLFDRIKANPNGYLEEIVAGHRNYVDFVLSADDFSLEEVRLAQLSQF